jgi:hypothetical protein
MRIRGPWAERPAVWPPGSLEVAQNRASIVGSRPYHGRKRNCHADCGPRGNLDDDDVCVYRSTWMFFFSQASLSAFGQTVTLTSPRCAFLSSSM